MIREKKFTYEDLRQMALKEDVNDNYAAIGLWIKRHGYIKHHTTDKTTKKQHTFYTHNEATA